MSSSRIAAALLVTALLAGCGRSQPIPPARGTFALYSETVPSTDRWRAYRASPVAHARNALEERQDNPAEGASYLRLTGSQHWHRIELDWGRRLDLSGFAGGTLHMRLRASSPLVLAHGVKVGLVHGRGSVVLPPFFVLDTVHFGNGQDWVEVDLPLAGSGTVLSDCIRVRIQSNVPYNATGQGSLLAGGVGIDVDDVYFSAAPYSGAAQPSISAELDPLVVTRFGGGMADDIQDVAADAQGNLYVTGGTRSSAGDFPVSPGAFQATHGGRSDAFVAKLAPTPGGLGVVWCTFLGGPGYDFGRAIAIDGQGNVVVGGGAGSGFPATAGTFQPHIAWDTRTSPEDPEDGFVAKLSPDGAVVWASYFGAIESELPGTFVHDVALAANGDVYVASESRSGRFPFHVGSALGAGWSRAAPEGPGARLLTVLARVSTHGDRLEWALSVGSSKWERQPSSIRVDGPGNVFLLTTDIPGTGQGRADFLLAKFSWSGQVLASAHLGGTGDEVLRGNNLVLDPSGNPVVCAGTWSRDFPMNLDPAAGPIPYALQYRGAYGLPSLDGLSGPASGDCVIAKLSSDLVSVLAATFLGDLHAEAIEGCGVDREGTIYVTGTTLSPNFPATEDLGLEASRGGRPNAFLAKLSPDLSGLYTSLRIGGAGDDRGGACFVLPDGRTVIGGRSDSDDLPEVRPMVLPARGRGDAFLGVFDPRGGLHYGS